MALKGTRPASGSEALNSFMLRYLDIAYDDGYTDHQFLNALDGRSRHGP